MRVIAGTYRSRPLLSPRGSATRPTSDRLRETLFNILAPRLEGARFADLYAGTGAVGIEALSRGAAHIFFAETAPAALATLRANLAALQIARNVTVEPKGALPLLDRLIHQSLANPTPANALDLIYIDPPWEATAQYTATLHLLGSARAAALLAPNTLIVAEHSSKSPLPPRFGLLQATRTLKQGDATLTFYAQES